MHGKRSQPFGKNCHVWQGCSTWPVKLLHGKDNGEYFKRLLRWKWLGNLHYSDYSDYLVCLSECMEDAQHVLVGLTTAAPPFRMWHANSECKLFLYEWMSLKRGKIADWGSSGPCIVSLILSAVWWRIVAVYYRLALVYPRLEPLNLTKSTWYFAAVEGSSALGFTVPSFVVLIPELELCVEYVRHLFHNRICFCIVAKIR